MTWNLALFWTINHLAAHTAWAHAFMAAYALWGGLVLLVLILGVAWWQHRQRPEAVLHSSMAILTGVSAIVALGLNQVAAQFWFEQRPFVALHGVTVVLAHSPDDSFPSDHATIAGALAVGIVLFARKWGVFAIIAGLFLAFARVYVGVHFPIDVIVGLLIGTGVALILVGLLARPLSRLLDRSLSGSPRLIIEAQRTRVPAPTCGR